MKFFGGVINRSPRRHLYLNCDIMPRRICDCRPRLLLVEHWAQSKRNCCCHLFTRQKPRFVENAYLWLYFLRTKGQIGWTNRRNVPLGWSIEDRFVNLSQSLHSPNKLCSRVIRRQLTQPPVIWHLSALIILSNQYDRLFLRHSLISCVNKFQFTSTRWSKWNGMTRDWDLHVYYAAVWE